MSNSANMRSHSRFAVALLILVGCGTASRVGASTDAPGEATGEVVCRSDARLDQLGNVAVATFAIEGVFEHSDADGNPTVTRRRNDQDTMAATEMFIRHLNTQGLTLLDRQQTDARIKELGYSTSILVQDETAPSMGNEYGANTLMVGRYVFNAAGKLTTGRGGKFLAPEKVFSQRLVVRVFDLESATVLCDVERGVQADNRLLPRSLARDAAQKLLSHLRASDQTPP